MSMAADIIKEDSAKPNDCEASMIARLVIVTLLFVGSVKSGDFRNHVHKYKNLTLRVESDQGTFLGTSFFFNTEGYLLTCDHVIELAGSPDSVSLTGWTYTTVTTQDTSLWLRRDWKARVIHRIPSLDVAILMIDTSRYHLEQIPIACFMHPDSVYEGQEVSICAFIPDAYTIPKPFLARGIVSTIRPGVYSKTLNATVDILQFDLNISKGTSGGPIFSTNNGLVVGMQAQGIFDSDSSTQTSYAIGMGIGQIASVLDSLGIAYAMK